MRHPRTAALLASVFAAGITVGYGVMAPRGEHAASLRPRAEEVASAATNATDPTNPADPKRAAPASSFTGESNRLRTLRSPEADDHGDPEALPTVPALAVCGAGFERRLCSGNDDGAPDTLTDDPGGTWAIGLRAPELPVHASVRIERFFRYLTESTNGRRLFRAWLKRSGRYRDGVERALRQHGLPQDLEAVVFVESGYAPTAVSKEGAAGLWQFMPGTARVYGLAVDEDYDERRSVAKSTDAAVRYLSDLHERFGSWELALAAYDMGYGKLIDRVQKISTNDYWTLSLVRGALPEEALRYVPRVLAVSLLLRNLDHYGFDGVTLDDRLATNDMDVPGGTPLALLARASGTSVDRIRLLNPELLSSLVPEHGRSIAMHVPPEGLARAEAMLPRLLARRRAGADDDRVDDGFDWGADDARPRPSRVRPPAWDDAIDEPTSTPRAEAADAGRDVPSKRPAPSDASDVAAKRPPASNDDARPVVAAPLPRKPVVEPPSPKPAIEGPPPRKPADEGPEEASVAVVFYRVDAGDSLGRIAHQFGVRTSRIVADNHLDPAAKLQRGMLLKLRVPASTLARLASMRTVDDTTDAPAPAAP